MDPLKNLLDVFDEEGPLLETLVEIPPYSSQLNDLETAAATGSKEPDPLVFFKPQRPM